MQSFKEFVGYFSNTGVDGYDSPSFGIGRSLNMPMPTLDIPFTTLQGKIDSIYYTDNPITIVLNGNKIWKLNKEQWEILKKQGKEPKIGKNVIVTTALDGTIHSVNYF